MNKYLFILTCGAAAQLLLSSCKKEEDVRPLIKQIIPLQVGNQWQYRVYLYSRDSTMYDSTATYTRSVLRDTIINNSMWYILSDRTIVQNTENGYAYYNVAGNQAVLIYQGNSMGGVGYHYQYPNYGLWIYTVPNHELQLIPNSKKGLSGHQYKIEYQYTYSNSGSPQIQKREEWVVPAIGLARWDTFFRDTDLLQRRLELISYTLK